MSLDKKTNILIVGLGLMGGSYAKALSRRGYSVSAITKDQKSIDYATDKGMIKKGSAFADRELISAADLIILAVYPHIVLDWLKENAKYIKKGAIITDVTGVKSNIVYDVQKILPQDTEFIAAHPMAGREVYGVENSDDKIFWGANYIVVPTEKNTPFAIGLCEELGWTLGFAYVSTLSPENHDEMIAFLSQLTHCIAVSLMCTKDNPDLVRYTGDSFRDLTRIAKINDEMWSELFLTNKEPLLREMEAFKQSFDSMYNALKNDDSDKMREMMRLSTTRRKLFDKQS
ncbi:MAG: prephenate dehydrogenase [Ruminococcaceae bacterium]|nr:prephenate dehydrogenase [Oscillospiraceae bacterium]